MAEIRQKSLIEMSRQLEEMRAHQAQQTEAEEQRSRAQELRSQAMQENISRMMEMMQTLMPRPVTYPSSSNHGNTTTPTLPHPSPRPPDPVVVTGTGNSAAAEQHVAHRAPLNSPGSNRSTDGASKIAENLNQGELTLGTDPSDLAAHDVLEEMPQPTKTIEVDLIDELTKDVDDDDSLEIASCIHCIQEDFEPPIVVDELPHQAALQVLDKMPRSFFSGELIFLDEIRKINEELVDGLNWKSPPIGSIDELDGMKVIEDVELRNTTPTTHALKLPTEFSEQESMTNGVVCVICFDPGGNNLSHRDHAMCLSNKNFEISAGEDNKSVDEVFSQLKESYQAATQGTHTSYAEHVLEVAAAQGKIGLGCTEILCFDPGGGSLLVVDNSLRLELGGGDLLVVNDSLKFELSLQEKCGLWCIDELLCEMTNALQISLFGDHVHNPFNLECDQGKENARWPNLVLDPSPFDSIACLETFCFDPGGEETLCTFDSLDWYCADMKLRDVAAELLGLKKRIAKVLYVQIELLDVPDDQLLVFVDNNEVVQYMGFVPYLLEFLLCDYAAGLATFYYGYPSYSPPRGLESCYTHEYIHISQSCDIGVPLSKDLDPTVFACLKQFLTENKLKKIALRVGDVSLSKEAELRASVFEAIEEEDQVVEKEEGLHPALLGSCNDRAKQLHWHECSVNKVDREELLKQKGCVIWITGLSGSGKSTVACALSRILHSMGRMTYVLDGDNLQHGLNSNLNFDAEDWTENIRRTGEVAKLFANACIICIASLKSPYIRDRDACCCCKLLPEENFIEVFNWSTHANLLSPATSIKMAEHLVVASSLKFVEEGIAYVYDSLSLKVIRFSYKVSFGVTHLIQELISIRVVTVAAAHDHHEGNVLILVFDPGGEHVQLMSLVAMLAFQSYILEDKDLLNKGELLQEYQY